MCGRFTLRSNAKDVAKLFEVDDVPKLEPRPNIRPTQQIAVVRANDEGARTFEMLRWGIVPRWAKAAKPTGLINARSETVAEKPTFRKAFKERRCLIPADGFYEWETVGKVKTPYRFELKEGELFALAGLWETWDGPDGKVQTCLILTTEANKLVESIHDRMPVILKPADYEKWLTAPADESESLLAKLKPFAASSMRKEAVEKL